MPQKPIGLRLDEELLVRVDAARGDVSRARWIMRAVEAYLAYLALQGRGVPGQVVVTSDELMIEHRGRSSAEAKRDVRPVPKGGRS